MLRVGAGGHLLLRAGRQFSLHRERGEEETGGSTRCQEDKSFPTGIRLFLVGSAPFFTLRVP